MKSLFADIFKSVNEIALGHSENVIHAIEGLRNSGVAVTTDKEGNQGIFTPASRKGALKSLEMFRKIAEKNGLTVSITRPDWAKEEEEEEKSQDHQKKVMKTNPDFVGIINKELAEACARRIIREGHDPNTWGGWILDSDGKDKYLVTGVPFELEFDEDGQPKPIGPHEGKVKNADPADPHHLPVRSDHRRYVCGMVYGNRRWSRRRYGGCCVCPCEKASAEAHLEVYLGGSHHGGWRIPHHHFRSAFRILYRHDGIGFPAC